MAIWSWNSILDAPSSSSLGGGFPPPSCHSSIAFEESKSWSIYVALGLGGPAFSARPCGYATVVRNAPRPRDELSTFSLPWYSCSERDASTRTLAPGTQGTKPLRGSGAAGGGRGGQLHRCHEGVALLHGLVARGARRSWGYPYPQRCRPPRSSMLPCYIMPMRCPPSFQPSF